MRRSHAARAGFKGNGLRVFADLDAAIEARRSAGQLSPEAARCIVERGVRNVAAEELRTGKAAMGILTSNGQKRYLALVGPVIRR